MSRLRLQELLQERWTYLGPHRVEVNGVEHWEVGIAELPDFFLAAETREVVLEELQPALRTFLESYTLRGEAPSRLEYPGRFPHSPASSAPRG